MRHPTYGQRPTANGQRPTANGQRFNAQRTEPFLSMDACKKKASSRGRYVECIVASSAQDFEVDWDLPGCTAGCADRRVELAGLECAARSHRAHGFVKIT